jgi:cellulose biosynthesis protein BcsQ
MLDVVLGSADVAQHDGPRGSDRMLKRLPTALARLDSSYRLALVDCPPSLGALTQAGLVASQRALVVTEPALFSVTAADRALRAVEDVRRTHAPGLSAAGVVVNRYRERSPEHRYRLGELQEMFGQLVLTPSIPERSALQQAQGASRSVHSWPGPAAAELGRLFDQHLSRVLRATSRKARATS